MTGIRAVIFDLDGCLVDSEPHSLEALAAEMRAIGLTDASAGQIRTHFLGVSMTDICRHITCSSGVAVPEDFVERVETRLFAVYAEKLRPIPGAGALLDRLEAAGIGMAIATGGSVRRMQRTLELGGFAARFRLRGFSADHVARGKPAPDLFLHAAEALGVPPAHCAVLEDSPHGVAGARAAGMAAVGFVGGSHLDGVRAAHRATLARAGADPVLDSLGPAFEALTGGGRAGGKRQK
ncbi:HAD-IA family hydrolase [Rhodobacteraceae bacterium 2CG4]|uniref:HAD-IA family hydrolase n=1 Tax=Halovulum marinum TaxID=2662447 RepID=A0A6L5YW31_9RHOB|nr:HAD family phosphatase [Halovulum marinum]MSU88448.1 HAD-IA family hydrolase [Halovulum marinum]